jgi:hypothetical protein
MTEQLPEMVQEYWPVQSIFRTTVHFCALWRQPWTQHVYLQPPATRNLSAPDDRRVCTYSGTTATK